LDDLKRELGIIKRCNTFQDPEEIEKEKEMEKKLRVQISNGNNPRVVTNSLTRYFSNKFLIGGKSKLASEVSLIVNVKVIYYC
jgi:hypothetical protein